MAKKKVVKKSITEMYLVASENEENILRELVGDILVGDIQYIGDNGVIGAGLTEHDALNSASENVKIAAEEEKEYDELSLYKITITHIRDIGVMYERKVTLLDGEK